MIIEKFLHKNVAAKPQPGYDYASAVLESMDDAIIIIDAAGRIQYANLSAQTLTGCHSDLSRIQKLADLFVLVDELSGRSSLDTFIDCFRDKHSIKLSSHCLLRRADGSEVAVDGSISPFQRTKNLCDGVVLVLRDVTESRRLTREITYQATHDALTNLVNRREFEHRLGRILRRYDETPGHALLYMDLDNFKIINDSCGHPAGDEALRQTADIFRSVIRERDSLGRLGGDEFALLMEHCPKDQAIRAARQLRQALLQYSFCWDDHTFKIGVSIGLVLISGSSSQTNLSYLLTIADQACYQAKKLDFNRIRIVEI
jgi:diguanylate cyclase (GGDEF)-like protein/PAS domain S-box-containing protein